MDFDFSDKFGYFWTPEQEYEFKYVDVKSKYWEILETASEIALKSIGTEGSDYMRADNNYDPDLWGMEGDDTLYGDYRNNVIYGGSERHGTDGQHLSQSGDQYSDNDFIAGGDGDDYMYGQAGNDRIVAGNGYDRLYGGDDNDILIGNGHGKNIHDGGHGVDAILLTRFSRQHPDEVWDFVDAGDRIFLHDDFIRQTGGIDSVVTTLWNGNAQLPSREARNIGDYYQSTEVKNANGRTLFFIEGPTLNGITIGWNERGMEVIGTNGDWDGAKFRNVEQLTSEDQWMQNNFL